MTNNLQKCVFRFPVSNDCVFLINAYSLDDALDSLAKLIGTESVVSLMYTVNQHLIKTE